MMRAGIVACLLCIFSVSIAGAAELSGDIMLGWRDVSVDGSANKYRQHVNLEDGGRLLGLRLDYEDDAAEGSMPDRMTVDLQNLGGDPFENIHVGIRKYGRYHVQYDRRKSDYFYNDLLVNPADASIDGSTGGDFHHFDYERVQERINLDIHFTPRASGNLSFDRYVREGNSTTTRDVERDEFEFEQPIDELSKQVTLGFRYRWDTLTLHVEERFREFDNQTTAFLPGFSAGANPPPDPTSLDFYFVGQPYGYDSNETQLNLAARPNDRLRWSFGVIAMRLDLDLLAHEQGQGIDFLGNPFSLDVNGAGAIEREIYLYDLEAGYSLSDRISVIAALRQQRMDQNGSIAMGGDAGFGDWRMDTQATELGLQFTASRDLTISAGWTTENRDTDAVEEAETIVSLTDSNTDRNGFFATANFRPSSRFNLSARIESNRVDDPFTLASATDAMRMRFRARYRLADGVTITASHQLNDLENDNTGWTARHAHTELRFSYDRERLQMGVGASVIDLERDYQQIVTGGTRQDLFAVAYRGDTTMFDAHGAYRITDAFSLGGSIRHYDNDGSFPTDRQNLGIYAEYELPQDYRVRLSYRNVDYNEDLEDYDADIIEIAVGLRW